MKGIKLGLLGICLCIAGLAFASSNVIAIGFSFVGIATAVAALCVKN